MLIQDIDLNIGISLGIAVYPDDGTEMSELLRKADARMYEAKVQSKDMMMKRTWGLAKKPSVRSNSSLFVPLIDGSLTLQSTDSV